MQEQFVPYELALELRELGFNEKCFSFYWSTPSLKHHKYLESGIRGEVRFGHFNNENRISAPLWQQAFDWFREKYNLHIIIDSNVNNSGYRCCIVNQNNNIYNNIDDRFNTYNEARLECLKKLIELCETQKN